MTTARCIHLIALLVSVTALLEVILNGSLNMKLAGMGLMAAIISFIALGVDLVRN